MGAQPTPPVRKPIPLREAAWKQFLRSRSIRIVKNFIVLPLIGTLLMGMIIGRIVDSIIGPKQYLVYVVGDESDPAVDAMLQAAAGGGAGTEFKSKLAGIPVATEVLDDSGDPEQARTLAHKLVNRPDVLMVVGHGSSTVTKRVLPIYMGTEPSTRAEPPIPVILTTETNPALLPRPARKEPVPPVLRLFPTDDNQAEEAAHFIADDQKAKSVWVVEDTSNPTYSEYLARQFLNAVYKQQHPLKVILWSNNLNLPPYFVDKLGIDWVFFAAADWRNALVLIRQLQAMQGTKEAKVLLSDASADKLLLKYGGTDVNGVYLLHPLTADDFNNGEYVNVGKEASDLVTGLIGRVHGDFDNLAEQKAPFGYRVRTWLGLRRVSDARRAVASFVEAAVIHGDTLTNSGIKVVIDKNTGTLVRSDASFHVWQVKDGKFTPIK
jgi:ABC-type branched-subunit amino acid transport system substrate-binding protein